MDMKQLDRMAKLGEDLPQGLASYKQSYYIASRGLYRQFEREEIDLTKARSEKAELIEAYKEGKEEWNYFLKLHEIMDKLQQLAKDGFNSVVEFEILELIEQVLH